MFFPDETNDFFAEGLYSTLSDKTPVADSK